VALLRGEVQNLLVISGRGVHATSPILAQRYSALRSGYDPSVCEYR
jgi:hypothetical protein